MPWRRAALALLLLAAGCDEAPVTQDSARRIVGQNFVEPVLLRAPDGVVIHALDYRAAHPRAVILLFHQAGSGKGEYATIAPRLVDMGFNALAIDQRSGGDMFSTNETVAARGRNAGYEEARPDLEAALAWAKGQKLPVILWGSSYSAALALQVAADRPDGIAALMLFSPGEYVGARGSVAAAAARIQVPLYVTSADDPAEEAAARAIFAEAKVKGRLFAVPRKGGLHGSSTLIETRNPESARDNWKSVTAFLDKVAPPPAEEEEAGNATR